MIRSWTALGLAIAMAGCGGSQEPPQSAGSRPALGEKSNADASLDSEWGVVMEGLRAKIAFTAPGREFRVGSPIVVTFALQNVSDKPQIVVHRGFWPNHRLDVVDSAGKPLRRTPAGKKLDALFGTVAIDEKTAPRTLAPREIDDAWEPLDLTPLFVFHGPGEYAVWYEYEHAQDAIVVSNRLRFELVQ